MSNNSQPMDAFLDLRPNLPRNDDTREEFRSFLREELERILPEAVERIWELPPIILKEPFADYRELLVEARALFVAGHFYACVAMCGIVGERLVKDLLRTSVLIEKDGAIQRPGDVVFDQFERVDISSIVRFLKEAELLRPQASKSATDLIQLRNDYAHARGKEPVKDATKAIKWLHAVVEDTVSVFKRYEVKNGTLVRKAAR